MNGAQRSEMHNRAVCRWVGWEWSSVQFPAVAILVESKSARSFQRPPTHPALYSQRIDCECDRKRFSSAAFFFFYKKKRTCCHPGGRAGIHCKDCAVIVNAFFLHDVQIGVSGSGYVNIPKWNRQGFFLRHKELNSRFIVMTINEVTLNRPEVSSGFRVICWFCQSRLFRFAVDPSE